MGTKERTGMAPGQPAGDPREYAWEFPSKAYAHANAETLRDAPVSGSVLDIATGTGQMIEALLETGKLRPGGTVLGVDRDPSAIRRAKTKFAHHPEITFAEAPAERIPAPSESFDLVTFGNAIHLTDVPAALAEVRRVLQPDGTVVINTSYTSTPYPEGKGMAWGRMAIMAARKAKAEGLAPTRAVNPPAISQEGYVDLLKEAGFREVDSRLVDVVFGKEEMLLLCGNPEFAEGAVPGIAIEDAERFLKEAVNEVFAGQPAQNGSEPFGFHRRWTLFSARK